MRCEEDHRNKGEQGTKLTYELRDEVHVVVPDDCLPWRFELREVIDLLHIVEHNKDDDHHQDAEDVGAQELTQDISIEGAEARN